MVSFVVTHKMRPAEVSGLAGLPYGKVFEELGFWLPRKSLTFEFDAPALLDDRLEVAIWVARFGRTSLRFGFEIAKLDETGARTTVTARGQVAMVAVDREHLRPIPLPPRLVDGLRRFAAADA